MGPGGGGRRAWKGSKSKPRPGPLKVHADNHHVTMNMYLAKTEGAGLQTVEALGPQSPEPGCA